MQKINLTVVTAGLEGVSAGQVRKIVRDVGRIFARDLLVQIEVTSIYDVPLPEIGPHQPFQAPGMYLTKFMEDWATIETFYHFLMPAIVDGRYKFFGGAALKVCCDPGHRGSISSAFTEKQSQNDPRDMIFSSTIIFAHELAHASGASHDDSGPNIMDPYVNMYGNHLKTLKFKRRAREEVKACLAKG